MINTPPLSPPSTDSGLVPFATGNLEIGWPGTHGFDAGGLAYTSAPPLVSVSLPERPAYTSVHGPQVDMPAFRVKPTGLVAIDGSALDTESDSPIAGVQSYRRIDEAAPPSDNLIAASPFVMPMDSFSQKSVRPDTSGASYVPYGVYDPAETTLFADPSGAAVPEKQIVANPSGRDFISPIPGAFTDLAGGQQLRGSAPIDAIRVRVAGIDGYTPQAQHQVAVIAEQIEEMGLSATVVAGASPQPIQLYVPQYRVDSQNHTSDLGWVRQDWTTLGAAARTTNALSSLSATLLYLALGVAALLGMVGAVVRGRHRARQAGVLRTAGWTRGQIVRWQTGPELALTGLVAVTAVAVIWGTGGRLTSWLPAALAVVIAAAGSAMATWRSSTERHRPRRTVPRLARTPWTVAARRLTARPAAAVARIVSWTVTSAAAAAAFAAITDADRRAGPTLLAGLVVDRASIANITFTVVIAASGVVLGAIAGRLDTANRRDELALLRRAGWRVGDLRRLAAATTGLIAVPAAALSVAAALLIAQLVVVPAEAAIATALAVWLLLTLASGAAHLSAALHTSPAKGSPRP